MGNVTGIDVHKDFLEVALRDKNGGIKTFRVDNTAEGLGRLIRLLRANGVSDAYFESTGDYYFALFYALKGAGIRPHVLNAYKAKRPDPNKTDEKDAIWLLKIGEAQLISDSYIPSDKVQVLRFLTRKRAKMMDRAADLKREIGSVLSRLGVNVRGLSSKLKAKDRSKLLADLINGRVKLEDVNDDFVRVIYTAVKDKETKPYLVVVRAYLREIRLIESEIRRIDGAIASIAKNYVEKIEVLTSIPGIGYNLAVSILAEIGDINRFPSPSNLASYAGLVPTARNSGGKNGQGKPTRKSNKRLRRYMYLAALAAIRSSSPKVRKWYKNLESRNKHFKVIVVAIARKLLVIIWHLLRRGEKWSEASYSKKPKGVPKGGRIRLTVKDAIKILEEAGYEVRKTNELTRRFNRLINRHKKSKNDKR